MSKQVLFTTDKNQIQSPEIVKGFKWRLDHYLRTETSEIRRAMRPMSNDLGQGIKIEQIIVEMNLGNCFDFEFEPAENDRLTVKSDQPEFGYQYFRLIFNDGVWKKGDYYTTKIQAKGVKVITKCIAEGKIQSLIVKSK